MDIDRIKAMEEALNKTAAAVKETDALLDRMEELRGKMTALSKYYGSAEWYEDREGELPEGVRAGVLSEDAAYDVITSLRDAAIRMLETGTDILKNRI